MNILRKYKILELTGFIDNNSKEIIDFIESWFDGLEECTLPSYPDSRFWFNKGKFVFRYTKYINLYVRNYDFLKVLLNKYPLNDSDIESIIQYMFEKALKLKVKTTVITYYHHSFEDALKLKVDTYENYQI